MKHTLTEKDYELLIALLPPPEQERVRKFRLVEDRARSLVGRLALWYFLLTRSLIAPSERPGFGRKARGKPTLTSPALDPPLGFNNSHEGRWVLLAVVRGEDAEVGADVMVLPDDPVDLQAGIYPQLTPVERRDLAIPLPVYERARRLTTLWTIKEGYTKAIGTGIGFGLERIEVELRPERRAENVRVDGREVEVDGWKVLHGLMPRSGYRSGAHGEEEGLGEGKVDVEETVGWALIWKGDEEDAWNGQMEVVEWDELVRVFEDIRPS